MTKNYALSIVASLLALDTCSHMRSARSIPSLAENTRQVISKNRDVAVALDIDDLYSQKLGIHLPDVGA